MALVWAAGQAAPGGEGAAFPALAYGAANALFVLMALFVWLDPHRYGVYVPLYTAGKVISAAAVLGWCGFSWQRIINTLFTDNSDMLTVLGLLLLIALGDIFSACGGAVLLRKLKRVDAAAEPSAAINSDDLQEHSL